MGEGGGGGGGRAVGMGAGLDDYEDDEHEPCSKKIMPALFAWLILNPNYFHSFFRVLK